MDREELAVLVDDAGEAPYRTQQIMEAIYRRRVDSLNEISTLPASFREKLAQAGATVGSPRIERSFVSQDGTVRYLISFADGQSVETVWMPEGDGGEAGDGSEAGELAESAGRLCGRLSVLSDGASRRKAQSHGGRNCRTSLCSSQSSASFAA